MLLCIALDKQQVVQQIEVMEFGQYCMCSVRVCRVRGLQNLRIIDASIIPSSLSGNSYTSQVMIAEKAADIVREKDTVTAIKEYFRHLLDIKHKKIMEEEETAHNVTDKKK